jgi:NADPH:quinone reductase-like Zn-dependent oxidoreductase
MKACRIHRFGPPDVIAFEETTLPPLAEHEILVQTKAAGVGPWDAWVRSGKSVLEQPLPLTLGSEFSGIVAQLGLGVHEFALGQEVFGATNQRFTGGYAEYAVASAAMVSSKPQALNHVESAGLPVVAVTALQMLFDHAQIQQQQRVLIHGSGGGVGASAVQ